MKFILQWLPWTASVIILAHIVSGFPGLVQDGVSDNVPIPGCQFAFHTANMSRRNPQYVQDHLAKRDMVPAGYQSFNGQGNNEDHPDWGAAGAIYLRKSPPMYGDNVNASPGGKNWPNPRNVSQYAFSLTPYPYHMSISELLPMWGSVVHSDVTVTIRDGEYFPIPVPAGDPILDPSATGTFVIPLLRTKYTGLKPEEGLNGTQNTRIMRNEFSAFIDASGLYGLDDATAAQVRGANGTLKSVNYTVLGEAPPLHPATGFFMFALEGGNAVPNFSVYYILLLREHNRRARQLLAVNPTWTSDKVFFEARRWVIAMVQRITMDYYYPLLLGVQAPPYRGYNSSIDPGIDIAFTTCAMRYGHSAINQMIYRLDENGDPIPAGHQLLEEAFWSSNVRSLLDVGIEPYIRGFATQPEQAVDGRYAPAVRNRLRFVKYPFVFDLIAVNIQRSREVGIADYNTLRETYNLSRAATWADITSDVEVRTRLEQLYGNSMDNIDAYVGMVIEDKVGNAVIGPLSATIIKEQLERIRDGDPYWYENPGIFTPEELVEIKETMKPGNLVLSNTNITHFPENPFVVAHQSAAAADLARSKLASGELSFLISDVMKLSWTITKDIITFVVESNSQGWFGFGFGKDMMKSDIFLFSRQSKGSSWHGQDSYSQNVIKPTADADIGGIDDMTDLIRVNKTSFKNAFKFSRRLDTNDPFDVPITNVDMSMIFAWGETELGYHGPQCRGHAVVNFFTGASSVEEDSRLFNLSLFHGIAMFVGFAYVYPVGIYIARYWKNGGTWLIYHQGLMALVSSEVNIAQVRSKREPFCRS
ncbi:heme peroxidase [Powellomyces hirtus]|nr:heme peroxidase [Powellomyces hirtus]